MRRTMSFCLAVQSDRSVRRESDGDLHDCLQAAWPAPEHGLRQRTCDTGARTEGHAYTCAGT